MQAVAGREKRRQDRRKAVLPVRVRGKDASGRSFDELAHTLDVTPTGARLGSIRHLLQLLDEVTVQYRQYKMIFRVVWIKKMAGVTEYQVGLEALTVDRDSWGLNPAEFKANEPSAPRSAASLST